MRSTNNHNTYNIILTSTWPANMTSATIADDRIVLLRPQPGVHDSDAPIDECNWLDSVNGGVRCWDKDDTVDGERTVVSH